MNDTIEADVDAKGTNCRCCGDELESNRGNRLCDGCETEGCDPSTNLCMKDLIADGGQDPGDAPPRELIEHAAEEHDVDLDHAISAIDPDPESSRIYILEEVPSGYRLIGYGLDAEGDYVDQHEPLHIPAGAIGELQGLFHAAGLQQSENLLAQESDQDGLGLREVAEGMGVAEPLGSGDQ